jgi:H+/Cl- antiporter ClcA
MLLGGVASIGAVFGNPFVTAFMILEFIALGVMPRVLMLPMFVALGAGYLTQVGIGSWNGFGVHPLTVPDLPSYESISLQDILVAVVASSVAAIVAIASRALAERIDKVNSQHLRLMPFAAAIVITGLVAVAVYAFDLTPQMVLFSGQGQAMSTLIDETAVGIVVAIVAIKALGYAVSLGSGMRGGPIFPATFLGVGIGVLFALIFSGTAVAPLAAAGIAATATAMIRLPFTSAMLALLLIGGAGMEVAPFAIIGAVVGFIVRQWLDSRISRTTNTAT